MIAQDLRRIALGDLPGTDVCVVGSGPAGATLVHELAETGLRVLLLESGDLTSRTAADALSEIENIGAPRVADQSIMRPRVLGGASSIWTGRCAPLDEIDFERRPWVPHSGWPVRPGDLVPFLDRSAAYLGLGMGSGFSEAGPPGVREGAGAAPRSFDAGLLRPFFWQFSRDRRRRFDSTRFGRSLLRTRVSDNVRLLTNATVTHIDTNHAASVVHAVEVADADGVRHTVPTRSLVLCAGGIENARILLASTRVAPAGLGNGRDLVGRFLMDHPRGGVALFDHTRQSALWPYMGNRVLPTGQGSFLFCKGARLSPEAQAREGLVNCAVWLSEAVMEDDPWSAAKRLLRGQGRRGANLRVMAANAGLFVRGLSKGALRGGPIPRKLSHLALNCTVEQTPDRDSRVMLSSRLDRHGIPFSRIDWRVNEQEQHTVRRTAELLAQEFGRLGLPLPALAPWVRERLQFPPDFQDVAHHMGTTRMSDHPGDGVVNADCQVHGIRGLYVAGSSVFPTGGHANPTQMIVALAIRLSDTLRQELGA